MILSAKDSLMNVLRTDQALVQTKALHNPVPTDIRSVAILTTTIFQFLEELVCHQPQAAAALGLHLEALQHGDKDVVSLLCMGRTNAEQEPMAGRSQISSTGRQVLGNFLGHACCLARTMTS